MVWCWSCEATKLDVGQGVAVAPRNWQGYLGRSFRAPPPAEVERGGVDKELA